MEEYAGDPLRVDAAYAGPPPDTETDDGPMS
jgi:hypothetical protein